MSNVTIATFTPNGMLRDVANAPAIDFNAGQRILADFSDSATQNWYTPDLICPVEFTGSGALKASIHFHSAGAGSGTQCRFEVVLEVMQAPGFDMESTNWHEPGNPVTAALATTAGRLVIVTFALTYKGTPTALAAGSHFRALLKRVPSHGDDDAVGNIRVSTWGLWEDNS